MKHKFLIVRILLSGILSGLSTVYGWLGWLIFLYAVSMLLDYITGTILALKEHKWNSTIARKGLWTKLGSTISVTVSALADIMLSVILQSIPSFPFSYETLLCPLTLIWFTITEFGSILENSGKMGTPIPTLLKNRISDIKNQVEEDRDKKAKTNNRKKN